MSLAQFDDIYDILLGMENEMVPEEENNLLEEEKIRINEPQRSDYRWWEEVVYEVELEEEKTNEKEVLLV